jgi:hypothetical protein
LRGVEECGADADRGQRVHLVLHERDEWRNDDSGAGPYQRRDLVAEGLASAGRHENERVAATDDLLDDVGLLLAERVVPEDAVKHLEGVRRCWTFFCESHGVTAP